LAETGGAAWLSFRADRRECQAHVQIAVLENYSPKFVASLFLTIRTVREKLKLKVLLSCWSDSP
jgi:hypothetical protein